MLFLFLFFKINSIFAFECNGEEGELKCKDVSLFLVKDLFSRNYDRVPKPIKKKPRNDEGKKKQKNNNGVDRLFPPTQAKEFFFEEEEPFGEEEGKKERR